MSVADKETKSCDDAGHQQPQLSASALLRAHDEMMKTKKRLQETSGPAERDDNVCSAPPPTDNSQSSSSSAVPSSLAESVREPHDRLSHGAEQEPSQRLKHVVRPKHKVPELGRGLSVSCGGFIDLDDTTCSSMSAAVTSDSAKVCVDIDHSLLIELCLAATVSSSASLLSSLSSSS